VRLDTGWECAETAAGAVAGPAALSGHSDVDWIPAQVPGTVASALRAAGRPVHRDRLDDSDWWFRCRFEGPGGPHRIQFAGIATLGDVWLNGEHVAVSATMHRGCAVDVDDLSGPCELVVRCAALAPVLAKRRPRPRWKTYMVENQQLRWIRTSLLGRIPGWAEVPPVVGLWRSVELRRLDGSTVTDVRLHARCLPEGGGTVEARFILPGAGAELLSVHGWARLVVGGVTAPLELRETVGGLSCAGAVTLPHAERWWPHTHGTQPRYEVAVELGDRVLSLGRVGFRTLAVEQSDGAFQLVVNGTPVFCRGAVWFPPDPVSPGAGGQSERHLLELARAGGLNMVRVPGTTVLPGPTFMDRCDELGILVWQDCMFAFMDPPDDEDFRVEAVAEVREAAANLDGHPCLAVVCGNQEVEEVAAMFGLSAERRATPLFDKILSDVVAEELPDVAYVPSNPFGGDQPFRMDQGVSQYFGVGGYLRPPEDARRSGVRFAAECLAFATPPEPATVDQLCGGAFRAGHDPEWKRGVHHDAGRSWDMEDVRDHYVAALFGDDPRRARYVDAERALELGRAVNAALMEAVFSEWRRPGSACAGGLVLGLSDLRAGAGWGLVDSIGRPKAPWYALRRVLAPIAILAVDEGLNGLALHVVNDGPEPLAGQLEVALVGTTDAVVERGELTVDVPAHGSLSIGAEEVLGAWRDVTYAYRFAPPGHDAVVATLRARGSDPEPPDPVPLAEVVHLLLGQARPLQADVGLEAAARRDVDGLWWVDVTTQRLAQWVTIRAEGFVPADSWFHLPPGARRSVQLWPEPQALSIEPVPGTEVALAVPRGTVQALNASRSVPIVGATWS
jgi:beta-mannosidase